MSGDKRLAVTFLVTLLILIGEVVGGCLSNSLALLSDAGHMVTDALAIGSCEEIPFQPSLRWKPESRVSVTA